NVAFPNVKKDANLQGAVLGASTWAWPAHDTPARQEFHDAFARFFPRADPSGPAAVGWTAAKAFETAMNGITIPEPPTSAAVLDGLYSLNGNDLGGLTYPLRFTRGKPAPRTSCWSVVMIKDNQWTAPLGANLKCDS
ncbi:MAG: ABC transporter substrate-binding protein, partial [Actinobacteria bacterium]|nr:ABC transporter substrate-binding protein [Actinomycetota bacterium]